jgi:hypothetical protein
MECAQQKCHSPKMIELEEKIKVLIKQRTELEIQLKDVNTQLSSLEKNHIKACGEMGHDLHTEREQGPYGERFTYCTRCAYSW